MLRANFFRLVRRAAPFFSVLLVTLSVWAQASTISVAGKTLKHLGTGLREFLYIDIYTLGAYSESGSCSPNDIINKEEVKALRLTLMRDLPSGRLRSNLKSTFDKNMPEGDTTALKQKVDGFLGAFQGDLKKGSQVDVAYVPGKGTSVTSNGTAIGATTPGADFAQLVWRSYFGDKPASQSLKDKILSQCGK